MIEELGNNLVPVLAISLAFLFFAIWVIAATLDSIYKTRCNYFLKERLIERGASASEIHQIIKAGETFDGENVVVPVPPVKAAVLSSSQ